MPRGKSGAVTQADMVRSALDELGGDAKPQAIQDHIKTKFDKELAKSIISNYKSNLKKKGGVGGTGRRRGRPAGGGAPAGGAGGLKVEHFEQVRGLVRQIGADQVKRLVDVLG